ncbi:hypothetical protein [Nocardia sp. NBC_01009]|uniref:hypothetical protein n=1 Tax=Nocardia sp. NBC_01009 TaxID=2975996 RepID=UPI003867D6E9|nr:hypothetical protein OHA42_33205 [Nocardia sp. NBC_01009]
MLEFGMLLIMVTALVGWLVIYLRGRRGIQPTEAETGALYLTGVSPRPDATGEQFVTITGNLTGPTVPGTVVYGRFVWDTNEWPSIGDYLSVVYPPGKPERFQLADPSARPDLGS